MRSYLHTNFLLTQSFLIDLASVSPSSKSTFMPDLLLQHESTEQLLKHCAEQCPAKILKSRLVYSNMGQKADFAV